MDSKGASAWVAEVKAVKARYGISYKEALTVASNERKRKQGEADNRSRSRSRSRKARRTTTTKQRARASSGVCEIQSGSRYGSETRRGPPYPANEAACRGLYKRGNDGSCYQSVPDKNKRHAWRKLAAIADRLCA